MLNVLIIEEDLEYSIKLFNFINQVHFDLRIIGIASNKKEVILQTTNHNIDIIIVSLDINEYDEIMQIMKNNVDRYKKSIILIGNEKRELNEKEKNIVYEYCKKTKSFEEIKNAMNKIIEEKTTGIQNEIKTQIKQELLNMGYDLSFIGTKYLIEVIFYLYNNRELVHLHSYEKYVYEPIGKKYGKTGHNVKCNIVNATEKMYLNRSKNGMLAIMSDNLKPKKIITNILEKVK